MPPAFVSAIYLPFVFPLHLSQGFDIHIYKLEMPTLNSQVKIATNSDPDYTAHQYEVEMLHIHDPVKYDSVKHKGSGALLFPTIDKSLELDSSGTSMICLPSYKENLDLDVLRGVPEASETVKDPSSVLGNLRNSGVKCTSTLLEEYLIREALAPTAKTERRKCSDQTARDKGRGNVKRGQKQKTGRHKGPRSIYSQKQESATAKSSTCDLYPKPSTCNLYPDLIKKSESHGPRSHNLGPLSGLCKRLTLHNKGYSSPSKAFVSKAHSRLPQSYAEIKSRQSSTAGRYSKKSTNAFEQANRMKSAKQNDEPKLGKIYFSDRHSGMLMDNGDKLPCAPPSTPAPDELTRVKYVPSLHDFRARKSIHERLRKLELTAVRKEKLEMEKNLKDERLTAKELKSELKRKQRREIYALNKMMTDLENARFNLFMQSAGPCA